MNDDSRFADSARQHSLPHDIVAIVEAAQNAGYAGGHVVVRNAVTNNPAVPAIKNL